MCKPVIAQSSEGLMLYCNEHQTREPVKDEKGFQTYYIGVLKHLDMLREHRAIHELPFFEKKRAVEKLVEQANTKE